MAYPTPIVEIAFNDGPYVASPTWTDVTSYVRSMNIDRGRTTDWNTFTGMAEVVLNNRTRLFDPFYTSGTYYGKLLPRRQIRIRATYSGTTYDVFRGFISGWPPSWTDAGGDSTVTLSCFDALQLLGQTQGPADWADYYIKNTLNPRHYWRMNEPIKAGVASQTLADSGSNPQSLSTGAIVQPGPQLYASGSSSSITGNWIPLVTDTLATGGNFSSGTMSTASTSYAFWADTYANVRVELNNFLCFITFATNNDGTYYVEVAIYSTTQDLGMKTANLTLNNGPHHVAVTLNTASSNAIKIYVDGEDYSSTKTTSAGGYSPTYENITINEGTISQVVLYTGVLSQANIRTLVAWSRLQNLQDSNLRMTYLLEVGQIPSAMQNVNALAEASILDISGGGPFLGPEMQIVANTEAAPLFCAKDGKVTFYNKNTIFTATKSTTSQQTYGSGGLPMGEDVNLYYDGDQVRNVINVQMSQGGVQTYTDSTSVTNYGTCAMDNQTQAANIATANISGNMYKTLGATPYPKTTPLEVVLKPDESWATTLGLELCERITIAIAPPTGNTITLPMLVQRISHQVEPGRWRTYLEGSNRWAQSYTP